MGVVIVVVAAAAAAAVVWLRRQNKQYHPCLSVCLSVQLCFASLLAAPRTALHNVVVSLFLRVLHSFAENVLTFAASHEVGSDCIGLIASWR